MERCSHLSGQQLLWGMGQINVQDFQAAPHIPARGFTGAGLRGMADRDNAAFTPGDPTLGSHSNGSAWQPRRLQRLNQLSLLWKELKHRGILSKTSFGCSGCPSRRKEEPTLL